VFCTVTAGILMCFKKIGCKNKSEKKLGKERKHDRRHKPNNLW